MSPYISVSASMSASMSASVLPRPCQVGGGAQHSESRCGLTQAAGSEAQEGQEPAAPGQEHTPGYTLQVLTGTHNELLSTRMDPEDFHRNTHRYKTKRTVTPRSTQRCQTQLVTRRYQQLTQTGFMKNPQTNPHPDTEKTPEPQISTGTQTHIFRHG